MTRSLLSPGSYSVGFCTTVAVLYLVAGGYENYSRARWGRLIEFRSCVQSSELAFVIHGLHRDNDRNIRRKSEDTIAALMPVLDIDGHNLHVGFRKICLLRKTIDIWRARHSILGLRSSLSCSERRFASTIAQEQRSLLALLVYDGHVSLSKASHSP